MDVLEILPLEIREKIILELDIKDLLNCSLVSKSWRSKMNIDIIWRHHCHRKCFLASNTIKPNPDCFEEMDTFSFDLEPLCLWRKIYSWYNNLRNNWIDRRFKRFKMSNDSSKSPVFSLDSDGKTAVSGHGDSSINVWDVESEPKLIETFYAKLNSVPVISVRIWNKYIVLLQKKLLQIYQKDGDSGYTLKHAKSFELSDDNMTLMDKVYVLGEKFDYWYNECLRVSDDSSASQIYLRRVIFAVTHDLTLASVGGSGELCVWKMSGEVRAHFSGFHSIRSIITIGKKVFIISGEECTIISEYSVLKNESLPVLRIPGWKKIIVTDEYIIAVPNRVDTSLKRIWVWDRNHVLIRTRNLSFGQISVAPVSYYVVYTENSQVTVWDPKSDAVINTFSAGLIIGFIKPAFSNLMVAFANNSVHVWDFMEGKRLYRIYSELEWVGDFRDQLWLNPSMIINGGVDKQMELLSFK